MKIATRDLEVIAFVARFGQVTRKQIRETVFAANKSATPCDRVVSALVKDKMLAEVGRPVRGGRYGGQGPIIYQIGPAGWNAAKTEGSFWLSRSIKPHSLAIAEVYVDISSRLKVIRFEAEPDSHTRVNYVPLNPDMYMELEINGQRARVWLEIDLGSERPKQLKEKMERYCHAWNGAGKTWTPFPWVWFVVPDLRRQREIESLIRLQPIDAQPMFHASTFESLVSDLVAEPLRT